MPASRSAHFLPNTCLDCVRSEVIIDPCYTPMVISLRALAIDIDPSGTPSYDGRVTVSPWALCFHWQTTCSRYALDSLSMPMAMLVLQHGVWQWVREVEKPSCRRPVQPIVTLLVTYAAICHLMSSLHG